MSELVQDVLREGSAFALLGVFGYVALRYVKDMFTQNKEFIDKQTDALSQTQKEYTSSLMRVVKDYERNSAETNVAMEKLVERIDAITKDIPDIRSTNLALKNQIRRTEEVIEILKRQS